MSRAARGVFPLTRSWAFRLYVGALGALACVVFLPPDANVTLYVVLFLASLPGSVVAVSMMLLVGTTVFEADDDDVAAHVTALVIWLTVIVAQGLVLARLVTRRSLRSAVHGAPSR